MPVSVDCFSRWSLAVSLYALADSAVCEAEACVGTLEVEDHSVVLDGARKIQVGCA